MKDYYVYIMANDNNNVFYIGVTNDLQRKRGRDPSTALRSAQDDNVRK